MKKKSNILLNIIIIILFEIWIQLLCCFFLLSIGIKSLRLYQNLSSFKIKILCSGFENLIRMWYQLNFLNIFHVIEKFEIILIFQFIFSQDQMGVFFLLIVIFRFKFSFINFAIWYIECDQRFLNDLVYLNMIYRILVF